MTPERARKKRALSPGVQASIAAMSGLAVIIGYENFSHIANELNNLLKISLDLYQIWIFGNDHVEQQRKLRIKEEHNDKLKIVIKFDKAKQQLARDLAKFIRDNVELEVLIFDKVQIVVPKMKDFNSNKSSSIIQSITTKKKKIATEQTEKLFKEKTINTGFDDGFKQIAEHETKVKFHRLIVLLGLVATARTYFEEISPLCLQYILLVRAMPAYRSTRDPPEPCKDDFDDYDWLNRVEVVAFKNLPLNFKEILHESYKERHRRWFYKGMHYQGEDAKEIMANLTVLHPYIDNDKYVLGGIPSFKHTKYGPSGAQSSFEELKENETKLRKTKSLNKRRRKRGLSHQERLYLFSTTGAMFLASALPVGPIGKAIIMLTRVSVSSYQATAFSLDYLKSLKKVKSETVDLTMTFNHKYQKVARDLTNFVRDNVEEEFHIVDGVKKVTLKIRHFNDSDKGKVVNEVMNHIRKHAETIRKQLLDVFYPDQKRDREEAEERVKQKLKDFDEEMDKKRRMAELHEKQMAQQRKWQQNPFVKFFNAIIPKKENLKESQNHIVEEKLNDPLPNQQEPAEPEQQSKNNPQDEEQPTQEESINSSIPKSLTLKDLLKFHQLSMLMGAAAIARDMFLHVSPECTLYIFVVRVMPAYRATTNPLAHCEEDFMSYDYLKRLEAIAFYGLPEELRSGLFEQLHKRHTKWFKEGIEYQGTYAKEIMNQTTSLHSYIKNDYWLAFGMEGPSSVDADPHLNYYKQKLKNGANNTQFDLVDLPITDFGQGGDGGD